MGGRGAEEPTFGELSGYLGYLSVSDADRVQRVRAGLADEGLEADAPGAISAGLAALDRLSQADPFRWDPASIKSAIGATGKEEGVRGRSLYVPLRLAWTGDPHGPDLATLVASLGHEESRRRLDTLA